MSTKLAKNNSFGRKVKNAFSEYFIRPQQYKNFYGKIYFSYNDVKSKLLTEYGTKGFIENIYIEVYHEYLHSIQNLISSKLEEHPKEIMK